MPKSLLSLALVGLALLTSISCGHSRGANSITQAELMRRTQELMDSVAPGNQEPWKKYYAENALIFDEKGRSMDKKALVADVTPMPAGYSGSIKVVNPHSIIDGDTAVLSYDSNETEVIFGQELHARYHSTDTWRRSHDVHEHDGEWRIIASQTLRYYEDPAEGAADAKKLPDYLGTYQITPGRERTVTIVDGKVFMQRDDQNADQTKKEELHPEAVSIFFRPGVEGRILFRYNKDGKVDAIIDRRNNEDIIWKKIK